MYRIVLFTCLVLFLGNGAFAQKDVLYDVNKIIISGNKKTKERVILRELNFKEDDRITLTEFKAVRYESEERLKNMGIFNDAEINYVVDTLRERLQISIYVIENWYIFPGLILELADRNFSEWWTNQDRSFERVNYGFRLEHINLTGRRDKLIAQAQTGFRKKYELIYNLPYLDHAGKWGAEAFAYYATQDELAYNTENNKAIFGGLSEQTLLRNFRAGVAVFYRPTLYDFHSFRLEMHKNSVDDFVVEELNPEYFLDNKKSNQFFIFNYRYILDRRIVRFFPHSGFLAYIDFKKEGLGLFNEFNNTSGSIGGEYYVPLLKGLVAGTSGKLKINIDRSPVSYVNNYGLGYGTDILGGYYLYVVDGTDYFYLKNSLRYKLIDKKFTFRSWMLFDQFKVLNIQLYTSLFFDTGYVVENNYSDKYNNTFSNRLLYGWGPAVNLVLYNNYMIGMNLGINHLGEKHYFFHFQTNF